MDARKKVAIYNAARTAAGETQHPAASALTTALNSDMEAPDDRTNFADAIDGTIGHLDAHQTSGVSDVARGNVLQTLQLASAVLDPQPVQAASPP